MCPSPFPPVSTWSVKLKAWIIFYLLQFRSVLENIVIHLLSQWEWKNSALLVFKLKWNMQLGSKGKYNFFFSPQFWSCDLLVWKAPYGGPMRARVKIVYSECFFWVEQVEWKTHPPSRSPGRGKSNVSLSPSMKRLLKAIHSCSRNRTLNPKVGIWTLCMLPFFPEKYFMKVE